MQECREQTVRNKLNAVTVTAIQICQTTKNSPIAIIDIGIARIIPTNTVQPTKTTHYHPPRCFIPELYTRKKDI